MSTSCDDIAYDEDFEEASDEDAARKSSRAAAQPHRAGEVPPAFEQQAAARPPRPGSRASAAGGRPPLVAAPPLEFGRQEATSRPGSQTGARRANRASTTASLEKGGAASITPSTTALGEESPPRGSSGSSGPGTARRVLRAKVSLKKDAQDSLGGRPGSNHSNGSFDPGGARGPRPSRTAAFAEGAPGGAARADPSSPRAGAVEPSKPLWLQSSGESMAAVRERNRLQLQQDDAGPGRGAAGLRPGSRGPLGCDPADAGLERTGTASGDDRQAKRLQQEIQRLTQRLKEAELFSTADDGLPKFQLEEVEIGCMIAQGGFSSVHHAKWHSTPCALKKIFDPVITEELKSEFENEVRMLRRLRHPHVVTLMAVCRVPPALSILTEFVAGGSLYELLHGAPASRKPDSPPCEPSALLPVVQQAAGALAYLHAMLVVHRDIKSQNVLLTEGRKPIAKLCDFGLARMRSELCTGTMQWAGTAPYMAPELFEKKRYTEGVDIFAFGVMVWEVASTEIPHANLDIPEIAHKVKHKEAAGLILVHGWPKSLKELLKDSLSVQQESRPPMPAVAKRLGAVILDLPAWDC